MKNIYISEIRKAVYGIINTYYFRSHQATYKQKSNIGESNLIKPGLHIHFLRFLLFIFFVAFQFIISQGAKGDSAGVRWAQVDQGVASYAYRAGAMMIQKDRISSISQQYGTLIFDGIRWNSATDTSSFPRSDYMGNMFLDSRGIVYAGGVSAEYDESNTPYSYIFESTDGLNFTPVQQFVDATGEGKIWNFTEDKYGNVWAGEYTTHSATTGAHLWRRRPDGIWTNVANWTHPEDHIHYVYYDPFRDALYVAIGDLDHGILKLPSSKINADGISSNDFSFILPTFQDGTPVEVTAITSDASYIYVGMDIHSPYGTYTRAISRITDDNNTQTIDVVYPLEGCAVWQWADVDDAGNIIFSSTGINEWSCADNFVNQILASSDSGATWTMVKDFGSSSTSEGMAYTGLASYYATNWSGLYGGGDGWGGPAMRAIIGRVIPTNTTFYVDETNGVDWTNLGISQSEPIKTLNYLELLDIQPGDTVQFIGSNTYTSPLIVGWGGNETTKISFRGNTTSTFAGGNITNSPAVIETFESTKDSWNFILNESGGSITADTSVVHNGSQSAKVVRGESGSVSLRLNDVFATNINEGDTMYLSYWVYYPTDQTVISDPTMLRIVDNSNYELRIRCYPQSGSNLLNEISVNIPIRGSWYIPARHSLASGTWHKIYIEDYLHSTDGSFKLYVDDVLWYNVNGIKTVTADGTLNNISYSNNENPITYYIDDLRFGKLPFDARGAINTNEYGYLDIGGFRVQGTNGLIISSNSTDIDLHDSIFNGLTSDAIISNGSANLNFYYNTIFGSGGFGIYATSSATIKNNVVYNSTTNDIFIADGVSLTGSNNWFMDSGLGGTGTYIDDGNSTWSGGDPFFTNSGSGDFHLLSPSPLIDAGTDISGFTSDFDGTIRPQGTASDIGAYEFSILTGYTLSVNKAGTGNGSVTSSPFGINCGMTCMSNFDYNTVVTLTAAPSTGSTFAGWNGSGCSGTGMCVVTMDGAKSVTARFMLNTYALIVNRSGTGSGSVTSVPSGIYCGTTCTANFGYNMIVTLTATASNGSTFAGWSGSGCSGTGTCVLTMDAAKSVTARFTLNTYALTVNKAGTGSGSVTSAPSGISCGTTCTANYSYNTVVTLTAAPITGSTFTGWSGSGCSGSGTCVLTMDAAKSVTATFTLNTYALTVTKTGTGSGSVTSAPFGISCGTTCTANYSYNTVVTLTAAPSNGSTFTGWSDSGCSGSGTCVLTMDAAKSVAASFTLNTYALTVNKPGTGSGSVTSTPSGINCGTTCTANYSYNTVVTLTATPSTGSTFAGWSGSGCSGTGTCVLTMDAAKSVAATFTLNTYALTVNKAGTGSGSVTSAPSGINCGTACSANYSYNTVVTLTASQITGSTFTGWSGSGCSGTGTCVLTMDAAKSVAASFTLNTYALTVNKAGTGSGSVTSAPSGINCGTTCTANYSYNMVVTLTATASNGSTFAGWSGSGCSGTGTCVLTMDAAKSVTATFTLNTYALMVNKAGTGSGSVTSAPSGISCGTTCTANYSYNTVVTLTAAPITGSTFTGWSGSGCSGSGTCVLTMDAAKSVAATFTLNTYALTVTKTGTGSGSVTSAPFGISCGTTCTANYSYNTVVTLTAAAINVSTFTGWSGSGCSGTGTCVLTMDAAKSVTATYRNLLFLPLILLTPGVN